MSTDLQDVQRLVALVAHHIDHKRWADLRALYASAVEVDYTSLFGGAPRQQGRGELVEGWRAALGRIVTQHLLGPVDVRLEGDRATASCHVRALHHAEGAPGGPDWEVLGHYTFGLVRGPEGFRIDRMALETFYQSGNRRLLQEAP